MSYRVHCNWCGKRLQHREDKAVLEATVERKSAASRREQDWAQERRPTLHFCVGENLDTNRMGMSDMRVDDPDSCFTRAMAAVNGRETEPPNLGLEWRLMPVPGGPQEKAPEPPTKEMRELLDRLPIAYRHALPRAGITSLSQLAEMSDEEILALPRVGAGMLRIIREAIGERDPGRGARPAALGDFDGEALRASTIEELEIGVRTYNALKRAEVHSLLDLYTRLREPIPGIGAQALDEIERALEKVLERS